MATFIAYHAVAFRQAPLNNIEPGTSSASSILLTEFMKLYISNGNINATEKLHIYKLQSTFSNSDTRMSVERVFSENVKSEKDYFPHCVLKNVIV